MEPQYGEGEGGAGGGLDARRESGHVDRRVLKTRAAIESAFLKLVRERGLDRLTVSELAREANIDRKTFYLHYGSIEGLLDQVFEQLLERIFAHIDMDQGGASPRDQVLAGLEEANAAIVEDPDFYRHAAACLSFDYALDHIGRAVERYARRRFGPDAMVDGRMRYIACFYLVGVVSVYSAWLGSDRSVPLPHITEYLADVLADGLGKAFEGAAGHGRAG